MRTLPWVSLGLFSLAALAGCQGGGGKGNLAEVAGTYSCTGYKVDGGTSEAGCTSQPWLYLELDGSYRFSSSEGTYRYRDQKITFTGDLGDRPPADFSELTKQITWTFIRDDTLFEITYYQREARVPTTEPPNADEDDLARVAGEYACDSGPGCGTVNPLVLEPDGTWYWETSVGEYDVSGSRVTFTTPYEGWGPDAWGTCRYDDGTLTFTKDGGSTVWVRQG